MNKSPTRIYESFAKLRKMKGLTPMTPEEFAALQKHHEQSFIQHHLRVHAYGLSLDSSDSVKSEWSMLKLLRDLSYLSVDFRRELVLSACNLAHKAFLSLAGRDKVCFFLCGGKHPITTPLWSYAKIWT